MPRFTFQLHGVLRQRRQAERDLQRVLAEKLASLQQLTDELRRMDAEVQRATEDLRQNRLTGSIDLSFIAAHRRYTLAMQRRAVDQARRIVAAQQAVEAARAELAEAAKRRKAIEKLRERRFEAWKTDLLRRETQQLDEVAMQLAYGQDQSG